MNNYERFLTVWTDVKMVWAWTIFAVIPSWVLIIEFIVLMAVRDGISIGVISFLIWFGVFAILLTLMTIDMWYRKITGKPKFHWLPGRKET